MSLEEKIRMLIVRLEREAELAEELSSDEYWDGKHAAYRDAVESLRETLEH